MGFLGVFRQKVIGFISILSRFLEGRSLNVLSFPLPIKGRYQRSAPWCAKRTETVFANLTWGWLACWGCCLIALAATGDFGKLKPYSSYSEDGKGDSDYSEPTANSQMLEAPTCRNQLLCFCRMLVCPSGLLKKSFLWGTNLLSHYIASLVDFSGLFQFLFSCLATLAKLGINHFPDLRIIRTWIIL